MTRFILVSVLALSYQLVSAQTLRFHLLDAGTNVPIQGVEVFSHEAHDKVNYTDKDGLVRFDTEHTDTLIFFKQSYQPLYIQVNHTNFDTTHMVVLKMTPAKGLQNHKVPSKFDKYQTSHYDFAHDSLSNSNIRITQYQPSTAMPKYNDKAFHVVEIGLDGKPNHHRSAYSRK